MSDALKSFFSFDEISEEKLLDICLFSPRNEKKTILFLGEVRCGKTTRFLQLIERIKALGLKVGGICQPESQGVYFARDIGSKEQQWIAERKGDSVFFNPEAFHWAAQRIMQARRSCDVLVVDEIGRLESFGKGHMPAVIQPIDDEKAFLHLLCVRKDAFNRVCRYLPEISGVVRLREIKKQK